MKLHREPRLGGVNDAFIGSIVGIDLGYKSCGRFAQERKSETCRLMNHKKRTKQNVPSKPIAVVHERNPVLWQRSLVHGKAMVLGGDVAALGSEIDHRLVHATIPKPTRRTD